MRTRASKALVVSLIFLTAGCGKQSSNPILAEPEPPAGTLPNTASVTIHVKDMTKVLNLV